MMLETIFGGNWAMEYSYTDRGYNVIAGHAPDGSLHACHCDICTSAQFVDPPTGAELGFVDRDRDLLVWPTGHCELTDEAEFAQNSVG